MTESSLYFIGIPVDGLLGDEIRSIQSFLRGKYDVSRQMRIPLHLTLIPPFRATEQEVKMIVSVTGDFSKATPSIIVGVNGFGHFSEKVLYVKVDKSPELMSLQSCLKSALLEKTGFRDGYSYQDFTPHITLANRDMDVSNFRKIWPKFENRTLMDKMRVQIVTLYKHIEGIWIPWINFELC